MPVSGNNGFQSAFIMPAPKKDISNRPIAGSVQPDPFVMAPFQIGDYVTVKGEMAKDAGGDFLMAYAVDANVGIFTAPGTLPAYVSIDVLLMGTGPINDPALAQEGAKRFRVEGFTTDISTAIRIAPLDVDACSGVGLDRDTSCSRRSIPVRRTARSPAAGASGRALHCSTSRDFRSCRRRARCTR